jgi:hypothetical protein
MHSTPFFLAQSYVPKTKVCQRQPPITHVPVLAKTSVSIEIES